MTIRTHLLLVRVLTPVGMVAGFLSVPVVLWFAVRVLGLPRPGDGSAVQLLMALATIAYFFFAVYGGARVLIERFQRRYLADCPRCGRAAVGFVFLTFNGGGVYRCRECGYEHPYRGTAAR